MTSETTANKNTQKLQRAIVDGLEDVKAQDIVVFNTEHLSPLFERVVVASGTSNRQTKALAASVLGVTIGFYDGFFGPGTGAFWILSLVTLLGLELTRANAYTKVVNLASNLGSLVVFAWLGHVAPWVALAMVGGQLIGARLGSGLVLKHGAGLIRGAFLAVVLALIAKLLWPV